MKKINRERAPRGTVTVRQKGNSFEARVTLELKATMEGVDRNPRISRSGKTEEEARKRLGELIIDEFFKAKKNSVTSQLFSNECEKELDNFEEYKLAKKEQKIQELADDYTLFPVMAQEWLNWKIKQVNPNTNKTIGKKTIETYIHTMKNHVMVEFKDYHVQDITKEIVENYINKKRQTTPRLAKDIFLMIRCILMYCKDNRKIISTVPTFDIKFPKPKRTKKKQIPYLSKDRQKVWLDILEKDNRGYSLLFAALLQTGMRPEERMWVEMEKYRF